MPAASAAPRRAFALTLAALTILAVLPPPAAAAPSIEGPLVGYGVASRYTIFALGYALEGGGADWTMICADCLIRITLVDSSVTYAEPSASGLLPPGTYEIREYRGLVQISGNYGRFDVLLSGSGDINPLYT